MIQHSAFTAGPIGDRFILKSDRDPTIYVEAARRLVPEVPVRVITPGERVLVPV